MDFTPAFDAVSKEFEATHRNLRSPRWEMYRQICEAVVIGSMIDSGDLEPDTGESHLTQEQGVALIRALI